MTRARCISSAEACNCSPGNGNQPQQQWQPLGVMFDDAINNFPPKPLPGGEWAMMHRDHRMNVSLLIGGVTSPLDWSVAAVTTSQPANGFRPEEPDWWTLPDRRLLALFRDNGGSKRFYRAVSSDNGLSWSTPEQTNFPDATSKFFCLRVSRGFYVLVSNANPAARNPLCLATSDDGITFTRLATLAIPDNSGVVPTDSRARIASLQRESYQYPHAIEHDRHLVIAFSRDKQAIEIVKLSLDAVDHL